jgi:hypothetical protein
MIRNTKKLRIKIYKNAINLYDNFTAIGFCSILLRSAYSVLYSSTDVSMIYNNNVPINFRTYYGNIIENYPELAKYEPKVYNNYWFPTDSKGIAKRIRILKKIIKEMEL